MIRTDDELVVEASPTLDTPPAPVDGRIVAVDMAYVDARFRHRYQCQHCRTPVDRADPHVCARGHQENAIGMHFFDVVFCDADCWSAWARHDPEP